MEFSEYKSSNGQSLPESLVKWRKILRQMRSEKEADIATKQGKIVVKSTQAATGFGFVINVLLAGSLKLVWGLIETLQVVVFQRLFKTKTPANVITVLNYFADFANFNIVETEEMTAKWSYFPESTIDIQANFESAGYDSEFITLNLELSFYMILL